MASFGNHADQALKRHLRELQARKCGTLAGTSAARAGVSVPGALMGNGGRPKKLLRTLRNCHLSAVLTYTYFFNSGGCALLMVPTPRAQGLQTQPTSRSRGRPGVLRLTSTIPLANRLLEAFTFSPRDTYGKPDGVDQL